MTSTLPVHEQRLLQFENGSAIGISNRWQNGQYCAILTAQGIVGCGIYDLSVAGEFGQAIAICRGTPAKPLCAPEDLYEAKIVAVTPQAQALGIEPGMPGRQAVEKMLSSGTANTAAAANVAGVQGLDHVTLVVADLERSRRFYCGALGMLDVPRPGFSFPGAWFQAGKSQIHLILAHEGSAPAGFPAAKSPRAGRNMHFAFEVPDALAAVAALSARGIHPLDEPRHRPDGPLQVFYEDPDGHIVELFSRGAAQN